MTTEPNNTNQPATTSDQPSVPNPNQAIIEEILQLMNLSSMSDEERTMWTVMLPSMETAELEKFRAVLAEEVQKLTDIYLKAKLAMKDEPKN